MAGYGLKKIPPDIFKFVIEEQNKIKKERGTNKLSFETVIYKMLREYKRCREENPNFKPQ
jgi:hypothetical protein